MGVITIDDQNPSVTYIGSWLAGGRPGLEYNGTAHGTRAVGPQVIFKFKGSSVFVFGTIPSGIPGTTTSSYSIDGSPATFIKLKPRRNEVVFRQLFYASHPLNPSTEHTLSISLTATCGNMFWIDYFQVEQISSPTSAKLTLNSSVVVTRQSYYNLSTSVSSNAVLPPTMTTIHIETQTKSASNVSHSTIISIALGSTVVALVLGIVAFLISRFLRRRGISRIKKISGRRVTAFPSAAYYNHPQSTSIYQLRTMAAEGPPTMYGSRGRYPIHGGLSTEKAAGMLDGGQQPSEHRNWDDLLEVSPPAYQSVVIDTVSSG